MGLGADIKNRLDEPKSMPLESMHAKNEIPTIIHIGCRGVRKAKAVEFDRRLPDRAVLYVIFCGESI